MREVRLPSTSLAFVSSLTLFSPQTIFLFGIFRQFFFLRSIHSVAGDKHPILDHNEQGFSMQAKKMLVPTKNKVSTLSAGRNENQNGKSGNTLFGSNTQRVPFGEIERNSNLQPCVRRNYTEMPMKFMRTNDHEMIPNHSAMVGQKENVNFFGGYFLRPF